LAELAIAGFDSRLYYDWPMVRALVVSARLTAVHGEGARAELLERLNAPGAKGPTAPDRITAIQLGEGIPLTPSQRASARQAVRARYGIPDEAVVFGCFGALTHDKRVPQIIEAFATIRDVADVRLLLGGEPAGPRDIAAEVSARNLNGLVTTTGYLESEAALTDHIAACDVSLNLRWPTARETSGPWVRALALGLPTITTRLRHTTDVPALDIRGARSEEREADPVTLAIDIVDEARELPVAMRLLASDAALRERLGRAAHAWWSHEHTFERMSSDYRRVIAAALDRPAPDVALPAHMRAKFQELLQGLMAPFGRRVTECIRDF
jgi:glycosyltransferase involved in cell wall biosynthesis